MVLLLLLFALVGKMTYSERASFISLQRWAKEDPTAQAKTGQAGLKDKFLREVDEHAAESGETLTEAERQRRANVRYRLHMKAIRRLRTMRANGEQPSTQAS